MKIVIQGRGINVRDSLKEYIEQELGRLDRLYPRIVDADVVLEGKLHQKEVLIKVNVPDQLLMATETADKFEIATEGAVDKLVEQVKKYKEKLRGH
ncbi:MAG: ribosome-associated translation inhibitor RaiA [bacterium]